NKAQTLEYWRAGRLKACPAVVAIHFETAPTVDGNAPDPVKKNAEALLQLTRGQFMAAGLMTFQPLPYCPIDTAEFDIYGLTAPKLVAGVAGVSETENAEVLEPEATPRESAPPVSGET